MRDCFLLLDETTSLYESGRNTVMGNWHMWMTGDGEGGSTSREPSSRANRSVLCSEPGAGLRWHLLPSVQAVLCLVSQSCPTLCDPMDYRPPRRLCPWGSLGKNTGVGCHALLQGIFSTQGSNPGLLHCRWNLYRLSHQFRQLPAFQHPVPSHMGIGLGSSTARADSRRPGTAQGLSVLPQATLSPFPGPGRMVPGGPVPLLRFPRFCGMSQQYLPKLIPTVLYFADHMKMESFFLNFGTDNNISKFYM